MADTPMTAVVLAFGSFGATPAWASLLVPPSGGFGSLAIKNNTNVRIGMRFATSAPAGGDANQSYLDPGEWGLFNRGPTDGALQGTLYVRGATANPASGDVIAEAVN